MPGAHHHEEGEEAQEKLEIHLGTDSTPPTDPKAQQLKSWANIIATTAALVTAIGALIKPPDQTVTKNTYEQLKTSIEQTNAAVKQDHDDMVALHNYLQGYFASSQISLPPVAQTSGSSSSGSGSGSGGSTPTPKKPTTSSATVGSLPMTTSTVLTFAPPAPAPAFPLPPVSSAAPAAPIPPYDSVAAKK